MNLIDWISKLTILFWTIIIAMEEENVNITEEEKLYEASPIDLINRQLSSANYYLDSDHSNHLRNHPYIS